MIREVITLVGTNDIFMVRLCSVAKILKSSGSYTRQRGGAEEESINSFCKKNGVPYEEFDTCKQAGISFREYFRRVILELKNGRTDYARSNLFALATKGTQEPASDDNRVKKILINHKI